MTEFIQLNDNGDLIVFDDGIWKVTDKYCLCDCKPKILARYLLPPKPSYWDLSPYAVEGFAKPAPYKRYWMLRECSVGVRYPNPDSKQLEVGVDGTLLGMENEFPGLKFNAKYDYEGYMTLQIYCVDAMGNRIEPDCLVW